MLNERGPVGDHGQDGRDGSKGEIGRAGPIGQTGPPGKAGKDVLNKTQTLVGFVFVVLCFVLLAYRSESNANHIRDGVERQDKFLVEICRTTPALAPQTCLIPR